VNLHGYPEISVGGQSIIRGRKMFDDGEPCPNYWPYLAQTGWHDRKAEVEAATKDA
jgi:hypothetical protein